MNQKKRAKQSPNKTHVVRKIYSIEELLELWDRMLEGDDNALIELLIVRGMAKVEDFYYE